MYYVYPDELYHHGIKGQKWGIRRYQNDDGSLTAAGKIRYYDSGEKKSLKTRRLEKRVSKLDNDIHSFDSVRKTGIINSRNGQVLLTKKDVSDSVAALKAQKKKAEAKLKFSQKYDQADKYGKKVLKSEASDKKIMAKRSEYREKWKSRWEKKVASGKMTKIKADQKLSDFDNATKYINAGNKKYNDIIKNYAKNKSLAKMNKDYKKSDTYKKAAKEYFNQKLWDAYYSNSYNPSLMTKKQYSSDMYRADKKKSS